MAIGAYVAFRPALPPTSRERQSAGGMYRSRVRAARAQRRVPCVQPPLRDPRLRRRRDLVDLPKIGAAAAACRGLRGRRTRRCSGDPNPVPLHVRAMTIRLAELTAERIVAFSTVGFWAAGFALLATGYVGLWGSLLTSLQRAATGARRANPAAQ